MRVGVEVKRAERSEPRVGGEREEGDSTRFIFFLVPHIHLVSISTRIMTESYLVIGGTYPFYSLPIPLDARSIVVVSLHSLTLFHLSTDPLRRVQAKDSSALLSSKHSSLATPTLPSPPSI